MAQGIHDVQKAGTGFVENVHFSFFIGSVEEGAWVIQSAQLDVEGTGAHGQELDFRVIKFPMPVSGFFSAAFHRADDVFTNQANGLVQIASEVVERGQGHHAGGEVGDGEMKVDDFPFPGDFLFQVGDELLFLFIGLPVDAVSYLHGEGHFSFRCMGRVVVQHFFFDGKFPLHFTELFQFVLYHLR